MSSACSFFLPVSHLASSPESQPLNPRPGPFLLAQEADRARIESEKACRWDSQLGLVGEIVLVPTCQHEHPPSRADEDSQLLLLLLGRLEGLGYGSEREERDLLPG